MNEFVTKPTSPNLLFEVIASWLRKREPRRGGRGGAGAGPARRAAPTRMRPRGMLDMAALALTFGGNPDKMRKYAFMFLDPRATAWATSARRSARGDMERVADIGHRMKSSARAVGAMDFAQLCHQLEQLRVGGAAGRCGRCCWRACWRCASSWPQHMAQELGEAAPI